MKKNKMMRTASGLMVATLLTTSIISGTFAKYTSTATGTDSARVASWGFDQNGSLAITDLFKTSYDNNNVKGEADVIAPGTANQVTFQYNYKGTQNAPEVAYTFKVDASKSTCADDIKNNANIQWKLDNDEWGDWDTMITAINALDGGTGADAGNYAAGVLPTGFDKNTTHTVYWRWVFDEKADNATSTTTNTDSTDTQMANKTDLDQVKIQIDITAEQVD